MFLEISIFNMHCYIYVGVLCYVVVVIVILTLHGIAQLLLGAYVLAMVAARRLGRITLFTT